MFRSGLRGQRAARRAAGFAYSGTDKVFLMAGGVTGFGATAFKDTWILDPATLTWKEEMPALKYANDSGNATFDRISYDAASNVFLMMSAGGGKTYAGGAYNAYTVRIWAYALSPARNYGRVRKTYVPPEGSLNRVPPVAESQSGPSIPPSRPPGIPSTRAGSKPARRSTPPIAARTIRTFSPGPASRRGTICRAEQRRTAPRSMRSLPSWAAPTIPS